MLDLQFLAVVFALVMVYFAYVNFKRKEINGIEMLVWLLAWTTALFMVLFPEIARGFVKAVFISRLLDALIMGGFVLVITMVALAYVRTRKIEKKLEELVRKLALKNMKSNEKK